MRIQWHPYNRPNNRIFCLQDKHHPYGTDTLNLHYIQTWLLRLYLRKTATFHNIRNHTSNGIPTYYTLRGVQPDLLMFFPFKAVIQSNSLYHTSSRPAEECRFQSYQHLGHVFTQAIRAVIESLFRKRET